MFGTRQPDRLLDIYPPAQYQTASSALFSAERVIVIWLAALAVLEARFSVGMLFAFLGYKDQFSQRVIALTDKLFELRMLRLHGERVADILLTEPEEQGLPQELSPGDLELSIELRNVSFRYADGDPWVLRGLNLTIPAGQCIALTGPSGSGKTTLVKLILGLLQPTEGEVLIGGMPLQQLGPATYRPMVAAVMQDDQLFAGSIADNIHFFDAIPDMQRAQQCAQWAAIHADIVAMPMGYHTMVGDTGSGLSGGQKQRILLARSLYRSPKLLVLDEATSHLDVWHERAVSAAIGQQQLTRVLVAHRPETIAMAQRVVVIEKGTVAMDTHAQLGHVAAANVEEESTAGSGV